MLYTKAVQYYESLVKESRGNDPKLQADLATAYEQQSQLADTAGAMDSEQKALAIRLLHATP